MDMNYRIWKAQTELRMGENATLKGMMDEYRGFVENGENDRAAEMWGAIKSATRYMRMRHNK